MKRLLHISFITVAAMVILLAGCMNTDGNDKEGQGKRKQERQAQSEKPGIYRVRNMDLDNGSKVIQTKEQAAIIPTLNHEGKEYISVRKLTEVLEFHIDWNPETQRLRVGDNDVAYEIFTNSTGILKEGEMINVADPPISIKDDTYISQAAVDTIFGEVMNYTWTTGELRIQPSEDMSSEEAEKLPDFQDDPNDPSKQARDISHLSTGVFGSFGDVASTKVNAAEVINTAKKYIGVKYDFGAGPFPETNRFDCSTFTQYVYGKHNVKLPRLSRAQAEKGIAVSRTNLRKGDLMFFYLPGRYKSNKIVGHVGIYMGNGNMIHASTKPKNGVQITSINKEYWKKTYLKSRRVAG